MAGCLSLFTSLLCLINYVTAESDVTLTCPTKWCSGYKVRMYCHVAKSSLNKCNTTEDIANFRMKRNTGIYETPCTVGPASYASCDQAWFQSQKLDCGCLQNETHYNFMYEFKADATLHDGSSWDCEQTCFDSGGTDNPLNTTSTPSCLNVAVTDCNAYPVKVTDLRCPCIFHTAIKSPVTCTINKQELVDANCAASANVVFESKTLGSSSGESCVSVFPPAFNSCSSDSVTADKACGCTAETPSTYTYVFNYVGNKESHEGGSLTCQVCSQPANPIRPDVGRSCRSLQFDSCGAGPCKNGGKCKPNTDYYNCDKTYRCRCPSSYKGYNCEVPVASRVTTSPVSDGITAESSSAVGIGIAIGVGIVAAVLVAALIIAQKRAQDGPPAAQAASRLLSTRLTSEFVPPTGAPVASDGVQKLTQKKDNLDSNVTSDTKASGHKSEVHYTLNKKCTHFEHFSCDHL